MIVFPKANLRAMVSRTWMTSRIATADIADAGAVAGQTRQSQSQKELSVEFAESLSSAVQIQEEEDAALARRLASESEWVGHSHRPPSRDYCAFLPRLTSRFSCLSVCLSVRPSVCLSACEICVLSHNPFGCAGNPIQ